MKLMFICQAVDENDPIHGATLRWIETMSQMPQIEMMKVVTLREGSYRLPSNVEVRCIGGQGKLPTLARFFRATVSFLRSGVDSFFVYQGGPYPLLLLPIKLLTGKPIYQWKAHPHISRMMRFYARVCDTIVFTSTTKAFPMKLSKLRVVGQGIDTEHFNMRDTEKTGDIVTVGRIAPVKQLELAASALARCNSLYGTTYSLDIYGPIPLQDDQYWESLKARIEALNLSNVVSFRGTITHSELPKVLNRYRVFVSFNDGALDRAVVEAMACGLPVITPNECVEEVLPQELRDLLIIPKHDTDVQAAAIHQLLSAEADQLLQIGRSLRENVVRNHNIGTLVDKILAEMMA